ncbi:aminoglycoside phosphotransferase family protein [Cognatishimia activa]|uniref:aminoglycoside phosphotransferase family protein n=1 Tax=Cognatishimia activa TaxID=1715691 RepID=UPI00223000E1|nr:aminoglycoside phosphotransferase family protein [Cognatishimia activa]UZD90576.1 aminoglycoside phosphotransferase family protein [Cognatishimia activa]
MTKLLPWSEEGNWHTLFGGRTNAAWQVVGPENEVPAVLKLYRSEAENPLFPNDPRAEATMLQHLQGQDIAPNLIAAFSVENMDCNLYHALDGERWTAGVFEVAQLIQRLHAVRPPSGLRQSANGTEAIMAQASSILAAAGAELELPSGLELISVPPSKKTVLLHCDIVPGNLIQGSDGLRLIDWQCPAIGDASEDLAVFLSPAMQLLYRGEPLSLEEENSFLTSFSQDQQNRFRALAPAYHYRMAAYCLWQMSRGRMEYEDALQVELAALNRS